MSNSRRKFLKEIGTTALLTSAGAWNAFGNEEKAEERILLSEKKFSSNEKIRLEKKFQPWDDNPGIYERGETNDPMIGESLQRA